MSDFPIGSLVIGTDGAKIYYGPIRSDEGSAYTIYSLIGKHAWWWLPKEKTVLLAQFVRSLDYISQNLRIADQKPGLHVLWFYLADRWLPRVGVLQASGQVRCPVLEDGECILRTGMLACYYNMSDVIDLCLEPYMKMIEGEK